jgi:hypothetical protein
VIALGCLGGGCGQSKVVEAIEAAAFMAYLVFLSWLAHGPWESSNGSK